MSIKPFINSKTTKAQLIEKLEDLDRHYRVAIEDSRLHEDAWKKAERSVANWKNSYFVERGMRFTLFSCGFITGSAVGYIFSFILFNYF